jgi:hypothetical protein
MDMSVRPSAGFGNPWPRSAARPGEVGLGWRRNALRPSACAPDIAASSWLMGGVRLGMAWRALAAASVGKEALWMG